MADFVKKLARIDGFADPYSHPFTNIKMNLDTGKYHATLLISIFTRDGNGSKTFFFYQKQHISFHHKMKRNEKAYSHAQRKSHRYVICYARLEPMEETEFDSKTGCDWHQCAASQADLNLYFQSRYRSSVVMFQKYDEEHSTRPYLEIYRCLKI